MTDSALWNRAINQFVLQSGSYPLISFTPTAIGGILGEVSTGAVLTLQIAGELPIPSVPRVAGVDEELVLEFDFVALAE